MTALSILHRFIVVCGLLRLHSAAAGPPLRRGVAAAPAFRMLSYGEIYAEMRRLEATYPEFVELYSAQAEFGVASPGDCGASGECEQLFMRITDERTLPELDRPEVFFSVNPPPSLFAAN